MLLLGVPRRKTPSLIPRQMLYRGMAAAFPRERLLRRGPVGCDQACLTFDDGPHPDQTPEILEELSYFGVQATFFIVGENAVRFPELVQRIVEAGHVLGHKGYFLERDHPATEEELAEEILMTEYRLQEIMGFTPRLYRPRDGELSIAAMRVLGRRNQTMILWNRDCGKPANPTAEALYKKFARKPIGVRDLVRLSELHPGTVSIIPKLITGAAISGVDFRSPLDWITQAHRV